MNNEITIEQVGEFIVKQIPMTFGVYDKAKADGNEAEMQWARGRIDAFFQILEALDDASLDLLRADWELRTGGRDWTKDVNPDDDKAE